MPSDAALGPGHYHEVLHTAHIVSSMFDQFIREHPATQQSPALREAADSLSSALADFYQLAGAETAKEMT